jgi:hypothetical protein
MSMRRQGARRQGKASAGFTLVEILSAVTISLVIILGIGQVDVTRILIKEQVLIFDQSAAAMTHIAKQLQQADRINLISAQSIQFRIPLNQPAGNLDNAANYKWSQYRYDGTANQILFFDNIGTPTPTCGVDRTFTGISAMNLQYQNEEPIAPPGGEPPVQDNNILLLTVSNRTNATLTTQVTIRAGAYTNLMDGLAPSGTSNPPNSSC